MNPKLYIVVESGNVDVLLQNINQIADEVTPNKNTVLHLASQFGKIQCVKVILSRHPTLLHQVNSSGESALHIAARNGHYDVVMELLGCAASLDAPELQIGGVGRVKEMLRMRNKEGDTALHDAVRYHHLDVVKSILQEDSEFSYTANRGGETPLYIAARRGYHDLVAVILGLCESPPPYGGPDGSTALHGAVIFRSQVCTRKIVDWNKSLVMKRDENGYSPLHYDALFGDFPYLASQLLDADNSVAYLVDNDKNTALHIGVSRGDYPLARKLILSCPDCCEMVNGRRQNILHIALENKDEFMVECILENCRGISSLMTQKDEDGNTALHLMAASNLKVRGLIKHAMTDKAALNKQHFTPLDMVAEEHGDLWVRMIDAFLMFKES